MLKSIKIDNFKSVQDLEIELGRVNVFIGENGCGKTSILEAIGLASAAISSKLDQEFLVSRGTRVVDQKLMKSAFEKGSVDKPIAITLTNSEGKSSKYDIDYKGKNLFVSNSTTTFGLIENGDNETKEFYENIASKIYSDKDFLQDIKSILPRQLPVDTDSDEFKPVQVNIEQIVQQYVQKALIEENDTFKRLTPNITKAISKEFNLLNFLIYTPENHFLRLFSDEGQISPIGIYGQGLFKHLVDLFKSDLSFVNHITTQLKLINWFEGLEIPLDLAFTETRLNIKDRFLKDSIDFFDQRSANEGFLYLLFYFTLFLSKETPDFFAIDNIDNALNPKLCKELVERIAVLANEKNKQVILTTHNPAILDGLDLKNDDQRLFVIFRNADGHTKAKRIMAPKDIDGIETVRLSEAFIRGYIGGLPKNF